MAFSDMIRHVSSYTIPSSASLIFISASVAAVGDFDGNCTDEVGAYRNFENSCITVGELSSACSQKALSTDALVGFITLSPWCDLLFPSLFAHWISFEPFGLSLRVFFKI